MAAAPHLSLYSLTPVRFDFLCFALLHNQLFLISHFHFFRTALQPVLLQIVIFCEIIPQESTHQIRFDSIRLTSTLNAPDSITASSHPCLNPTPPSQKQPTHTHTPCLSISKPPLLTSGGSIARQDPAPVAGAAARDTKKMSSWVRIHDELSARTTDALEDARGWSSKLVEVLFHKKSTAGGIRMRGWSCPQWNTRRCTEMVWLSTGRIRMSFMTMAIVKMAVMVD